MRCVGVVSVVAALFVSSPVFAQTGSITGTVTSAEGATPVAGAQVVVVGTGRGALTRDDGRYTITLQPGTYTVRAMRIGFTPDSATGVTVTAGASTTADFQLKPSANVLQTVVSIGYGERATRNVASAVATVTDSQFNTGRIISPEQLIQAKIPGVQVLTSGQPGGGISLRIRGGSSVTSSNEPLYVVDGVPLPVGGGVSDAGSNSPGRNALNFLNPDDIESMTVLKDAASTAIYGSRGANGVVMITTKSGKHMQTPQLTYTTSVSHSEVVRSPELMNAAQFRTAVTTYFPSKLSLLGDANTNWLDLIERSANGQDHSLAVAGTREDMNYRLSFNYLDQSGIIRGTTAKRVATALSYGDQLLNRRLEVQAHVTGSRTLDLFTPGSVLGSAISMPPTQPVRTATGDYFQWDNPNAPANPVAELAVVSEEGTTYRSIGNVQGKYRASFLEGLSGNVNLGYDVAKAERTNFYPSTAFGQRFGLGGSYSRWNPSHLNTVLETYANYSRLLDPLQSDVDLTAGYSYEKSTADYPSVVAQGLASDVLGTSGIPAATLQQALLTQDESRLVSGFARLNATMLDKYLLTLSVRRDGSSKFRPGHQWGVFPAVAVGWRLSQEPLMQSFPTVSDLKLRASWGVNGNQAILNYLAYSSYTFGNSQSQAQFGNTWVSTARPSAADPDIKWERTTSFDVGLDYGFSNDRITGTLDFYNKETKDLLFNVPVPAGTNLSNYLTTNLGSVRNRGFELGLNVRVLDGGAKGLGWDAGFTASTNRNELLSIDAAGLTDQRILVGGISGGVGTNIQVLEPGRPINSFFVYQHKRDNGKPVYADVNGDGKIDDQDLYVDLNGDGKIDQNDRRPYKDPAPKWILGQSSQLRYGNLDASYTLRAYLGNYVYNNVASNLGHYDVLTYPAPNNLHTSVLKYGFVGPQYFSDVYVEDASFLRMDNIQVGYAIHGLRSVRQLRVFGAVQNAFTITRYSGVDPESFTISRANGLDAANNGIDNNLYPRSRTYVVGTNLTF
jgi:TonB-linked SusC/RagA family outer membrane protein